MGQILARPEPEYHRCEPLDPSPPPSSNLLDYLDDRADHIFWR
jgi:hypothetical protein